LRNLVARQGRYMPSNIEIKARVTDLPNLNHIAAKISDVPGVLLKQEDVFFHTPNGRLKLRILNPNRGELIFYQRADQAGPHYSSYTVANTTDPASLRNVLTCALGIRGIVKKERHLYQLGQTRIHLDEVEGLGSFVELEFVMHPGQEINEGTASLQALIEQLGIREEDGVACAYVDLLSPLTGND
jgi:predicted adenylyl cyclase CyaB